MTKRIKQKKELSKDFKKKKVKLGKKLKKPENETKTEFKSRKLIIREQLQERAEFELLNRRKLSIKELCARVSHKSDRVREDTLKILRSSIGEQTKSELAPYSLSYIINAVSPCILEINSKIRQAAMKTLEVLIQKMGLTLQPYFSILRNYVRCSMVHINVNVQMDSLYIMDVLITGLPSLIANAGNSILEIYLSLISKKIKSSNVTQENSCKPLQHFDPNSHVSTLSWRTSLLESLARYLEAIISEERRREKDIPISPWEIIMQNVDHRHDPEDPSELLKIIYEQDFLEEFCSRLVPVFVSLWADALSEVSNIQDNPLPQIGARVLKVILKLLLLMARLAEMQSSEDKEHKWLKNMVTQSLGEKILDGFPYSVIKKIKEIETHVEDINLDVCRFALNYCSPSAVERQTMVSYLAKLLRAADKDGYYSLTGTVGVICDLLGRQGPNYKHQHEQILSAALVCFKRRKSSPKAQIEMLKIPMQMTEHSCWHLRRTPVSAAWIRAVLECAQKNEDEAFYDVIQQFFLRRMPSTDEAYEELALSS